MQQIEVNPYQSPHGEEEPKTATPARSFWMVVFTTILLTFFVIVVAASQSSFRNMFEEFELELPFLTTCVTSPTFVVLFAVLPIAAVIKEFLTSRRRTLTFTNLSILVLGGVMMGMYLIGVFSPLLTITQALS